MLANGRNVEVSMWDLPCRIEWWRASRKKLAVKKESCKIPTLSNIRCGVRFPAASNFNRASAHKENVMHVLRLSTTNDQEVTDVDIRVEDGDVFFVDAAKDEEILRLSARAARLLVAFLEVTP